MDKPDNKLNVDQLLAQMGSRTQPNAVQTENSKAAVKAHWQKMVQQKKQQQQKKYLWALAASVLLTASLVIFNLNTVPVTTAPMQLATVSNYSGDVQIRQKIDNTWHTLQANETVFSNSMFKTTDDSYVALKLTDGSEIRIADNTQLSWSEQTITLLQGKIYHDTDDALATEVAPLTIATVNGSVQHIGTRYMVSQNGNDVAVAVRSGSVKLTAANTQTAEELTIEHSQLAKINQQGEVAVEPVTAFDPLWDWTFVAQAGFDLENKSLFQFVQWFAEQSGLTVDWQNHESQTKRVRLQGNIKNMQPELAINTVFQSTQFNYEIENGVLQINNQKK
jgi:hypothetical protein